MYNLNKLHFKKFIFYSTHILKLSLPRFYIEKTLPNELARAKEYDQIDLNNRVGYYCKLSHPFCLNNEAKSYVDLSVWNGRSAQCLDLKQYLRYFSSRFGFYYRLGDVTTVPIVPTFLKSRPISTENNNSIILKLNAGRFYDFAQDRLSFIEKKPIAVFRGPCHKKHRQIFIDQTYKFPCADIGDTRSSEKQRPYYKSFMSQADQLKFKYIISVEGNDVATNLSWIMASNSLAFMKKPKYETWFMQGRLIPNHHYVLLRDDYSDLQEKIEYYNRNSDEALQILSNAQKHVSQFFDHKREKLISLLVLKKYFELSGQM
jgi:hypothetical protein